MDFWVSILIFFHNFKIDTQIHTESKCFTLKIFLIFKYDIHTLLCIEYMYIWKILSVKHITKEQLSMPYWKTKFCFILNYPKFARDLKNTQTQTQNSHTQKIENSNPNFNFWVFLGTYVWLYYINWYIALLRGLVSWSLRALKFLWN